MRLGASMKAYRTKAEMAFELLKQSIKEGKLKPGELVPQRMLAQRLGMSLTPVREAVRRLETEGYLSGGSYKTLRVRDITTEEARETYLIRALLEGYATTEAVPRLTRADMDKLEGLVDEMTEASVRRKFRRYQTLNG